MCAGMINVGKTVMAGKLFWIRTEVTTETFCCDFWDLVDLEGSTSSPGYSTSSRAAFNILFLNAGGGGDHKVRIVRDAGGGGGGGGVGHIFFQNTVSTFVLSGGSAAHFPENQLVEGTKGGVQPQKSILPQISILGMGFVLGFEVFFPFFGFFYFVSFFCNFLFNSTALKTKPLLNSGYNLSISQCLMSCLKQFMSRYLILYTKTQSVPWFLNS